MSQRGSFLHLPREDFAATMTDEEREVWARHFSRLELLLAEGILVLASPTLGRLSTGIAVFEAPDEATARAIMNEDPVLSGGFVQGELRPFRVALLRSPKPTELSGAGLHRRCRNARTCWRHLTLALRDGALRLEATSGAPISGTGRMLFRPAGPEGRSGPCHG